MKTKLGIALKQLLVIASLTLVLLSIETKATSQICADPTNVIYGLGLNGLIYPLTISTSTKGACINTGTTNTPGGSAYNANGMGYTNINGKFYYFWVNPGSTTGDPGKFVSYDPVTKTYEVLSTTSGPRNPINSGSVTSDGRYFCLDVLGNIFCYTISSNTWVLITSNIIDQDGNDVDELIRTYSTGDMAFDGQGNLWILPSGSGKVGLYKIQTPITNNYVATMTATRVLSTTQSAPDGKNAYGIAFNQSGEIFISTASNLYSFNANTLVFTLKMALTGIQDLTSCNFPMTVMPITWVSFTAKANNKNQVLLNWQVEKQKNTKGYLIQYSRDQIKWDDVSFVELKEDAKEIETYSYSYWSGVSEKNYFRIKLVDADGKSSYSPVRSLNMEEVDVVSVYPNPVRDVLNIAYSDRESSMAKIIDMSGRVLQSFPLKNGNNQINVSTIKAGVYFISVNQASGKTMTTKMIKQ